MTATLADLMPVVAPTVLGGLTGAVGWLMGSRHRKVTDDTSAFDLYTRAIAEVGKSEEARSRDREIVASMQREVSRARDELAACLSARAQLNTEMVAVRASIARVDAQLITATAAAARTRNERDST